MRRFLRSAAMAFAVLTLTSFAGLLPLTCTLASLAAFLFSAA